MELKNIPINTLYWLKEYFRNLVDLINIVVKKVQADIRIIPSPVHINTDSTDLVIKTTTVSQLKYAKKAKIAMMTIAPKRLSARALSLKLGPLTPAELRLLDLLVTTGLHPLYDQFGLCNDMQMSLCPFICICLTQGGLLMRLSTNLKDTNLRLHFLMKTILLLA